MVNTPSVPSSRSRRPGSPATSPPGSATRRARANCEPAHAHRQSQHPDVARYADLDLRLGRAVLKGHDVCRAPKLFAGLPGTQPGPRAGTVLIVALSFT